MIGHPVLWGGAHCDDERVIVECDSLILPGRRVHEVDGDRLRLGVDAARIRAEEFPDVPAVRCKSCQLQVYLELSSALPEGERAQLWSSHFISSAMG